MTTIQIFALIGVFVIGTIVGGYVTARLLRFALRHSTVVGMEVGKCENLKCNLTHLRINTLNATASFGISQWALCIEPKIGDILIKAFNAAKEVTPP